MHDQSSDFSPTSPGPQSSLQFGVDGGAWVVILVVVVIGSVDVVVLGVEEVVVVGSVDVVVDTVDDLVVDCVDIVVVMGSVVVMGGIVGSVVPEQLPGSPSTQSLTMLLKIFPVGQITTSSLLNKHKTYLSHSPINSNTP